MNTMDKIKYGDVDIPSDTFEPENLKVRITTFIDGDLLEECRRQARKLGIGYQTLINMKLREIVLGKTQSEEASLLDRVVNIETSIETIAKLLKAKNNTRQAKAHP
jgi:hypothetical protein